MVRKFVTKPCGFCGKRSYWESEAEIADDDVDAIMKASERLLDKHEELHAARHFDEFMKEVDSGALDC